MLAIDYYGISVIIAAVFSGLAALIAAWGARTGSNTNKQVSTNGDPRTLGQIATDTANKIGATAETSPVPGEEKPKAP